MTLEDLSLYIDDLMKMGFVTEQKNKEGKTDYKLTELGIKSGLNNFTN